MKKFEGILLCTDMDGTLLQDDKTVRSEDSEAIRYFVENGGLFTVASGRNADFIRRYSESFVPNTLAVLVNGTVIFDLINDCVVREIPLIGEASAVTEYVYDNFESIFKAYAMTVNENVILFNRIENIPLDKSRLSPEKKLLKTVFVGKDEASTLELKRDLTEKFGDILEFDRSWSVGLEMHSIGSGKGSSVKQLKEFTGAHTLVCVGDYENDIKMLQSADIGIAVGNAIEAVKSAADKVTVPNSECAICNVISKL